MFSGIIQSLGTLEKIIRADEKAEMVIRTESDFKDFELGESIAVNGVCLTVRDSGDHFFIVDLSTETLNRTGFKEVKERAKVNLERSLTPSQKISGHFVSGHVDLARKTGATIIYGPNAQTDYKIHSAKDNEEFKLGGVWVHGISNNISHNCFIFKIKFIL